MWHPGTSATVAKATRNCGLVYAYQRQDLLYSSGNEAISYYVRHECWYNTGLGTTSYAKVERYDGYAHLDAIGRSTCSQTNNSIVQSNKLKASGASVCAPNAQTSSSCPKGWGTRRSGSGNGVDCGTYYTGYKAGTSGYYTNDPVYGYVTRYRTKYYTYIASRVAKT